MVEEFLDSWRSHIQDRLSNPILGPLTAGWLIFNWEAVVIVVFGGIPMLDRIQYVHERYSNWESLLFYPALFAIGYALIVPWLTYGVQCAQERATTGRREHKLKSETNHLKASVEKAEAQAHLDRILAREKITRDELDEIEAAREKIEQDRVEAEMSLQRKEEKINELMEESKQKLDYDSQAAAAARAEADDLRRELEAQRHRQDIELREAQQQIDDQKRSLLNSLNVSEEGMSVFNENELKRKVTAGSFSLYYNPAHKSNPFKTIAFQPNGTVGKGSNHNESKWRIENGRLEILQEDGKVYSRFNYIPQSNIFLHTNEDNTLSKKGQYVIPEGTEKKD